MKVIGVIPARYESTRLPRKLLRDICGKPLLQWTYEAASKSKLLDKLIIACDDAKIKEACDSFGANCVMTSLDHKSGTDRIAEAVAAIDAKIIINIQADEPLINPAVIDGLAETMLASESLVMATVKRKISDSCEIDNPNAVKVVCDKDGFALYFSRHAIPYKRDVATDVIYYKHLGIYAYTKDFLYVFKKLTSSVLENAEKLEQLRVLEAGYKIKVIETRFDTVGVDTAQDLEKVIEIIRGKSAACR
jgi:3-deoxy-manno-octulosonate cytidylyltransferase (CMP-KDO synthetase)